MSQSFGDMAFSPKGVIWVLSIFERIRLSRYCAAIRERNSCLYRICKKHIFCSKYMINPIKQHFDIAILRFGGVNLFFLFLTQNIDCGNTLEAVLTCTHNQCFEQKC